MSETQRYSEKRLEDSFVVHLLLRDPVCFSPAELIAAADVEYPGLGEWETTLAPMPIDTSQTVSLGVLMSTDHQNETVMITSNIHDRAPSDHYASAVYRAKLFPGAQAALDEHTHILTFSTGSKGADIVSRFPRRMSTAKRR